MLASEKKPKKKTRHNIFYYYMHNETIFRCGTLFKSKSSASNKQSRSQSKLTSLANKK